VSHASRFEPFTAGEHFRVLPPGVERTRPGDLVVARGAFGSGEHETTASCLDALASMPALHRARVLDLGCGTGVLGVAAAVLGAARVVCVDLDLDAVVTTRRNCALNGVSRRVVAVGGTLAAVGRTVFDVVLANIHADILVDLAGDLVARTAPDGRLVLSGILWEDSWAVRTTYCRLGCRIVALRMLTEYCTVLLEAPDHGIGTNTHKNT
jgi:ribosomal protein L11 methyltransferase